MEQQLGRICRIYKSEFLLISPERSQVGVLHVVVYMYIHTSRDSVNIRH